MLANDGLLANYLSRNHQIPHYAETDGEKVLMLLRHWNSTRNASGIESAHKYAKELHNRRNPLGALLLCQETQDFVMTLYEFSDHFHSSRCMTGQWMKSTLNDVSGGVICHNFLCNIVSKSH